MSLRFALLVALAACIAGASLVAGSSGVSGADAMAALLGSFAEPARTVVMELRLPRVLSAFGIGALLAVAGVLLQALFRNPLADSYVLGVSGGSALGALLALLVGSSLWLVQTAAATGAILVTLLVLALARGGATVRVLLTGVVIASACGALVTLVLVLADSGQLRGMMFWLAGDLGWAARPWTMAAAALLATAAVALIARPLDVLATGETTAQSLGLNLSRWRVVIVILSGLLTAGAVSTGVPNCTSSMARPLSTPDTLLSFQRTQMSAPFATARPVMVPETAARLAARLPSFLPVPPTVPGTLKSSPVTAVQVAPVSVSGVALVLYSKASLSATVAWYCHTSPV